MSKSPLVSICVPTYNGRDHLKECMASIRAQSFTDFEVVICDDQSSDGTLDFARELAGGDGRFRFIANPRRFGLVGNWNNTIAQARGEWIKLLFQDDLLAPSCVEKLLAACQRESRLFGFCERDFIFEGSLADMSEEWFRENRQRIDADYRENPVIDEAAGVRIVLRQPSYNPVGEPPVTLIHRSIFQEVGEFDDALANSCDSEFWCRVLVNYGAVYVPEALATFRVHGKATTAQNHDKKLYQIAILDPMVMRYRITYGNGYQRMRENYLTPGGRILLRIDCARHAGYAWWKSWRSSRFSEHSSFKLADEWREIKKHCPGLQTLAWLGLGVALLHRTLKLFQKLLGRGKPDEPFFEVRSR